MSSIEGKRILITGGSRGIGEALVRTLAAHGAKVAFTYRSSATNAEKIQSELEAAGHWAKAYQSDAAKYEDAEKLVTAVLEDLESLDVLINNAGITKDNLMLRMDESQWDQVIETNLKSVFNLTKQVLKPMMRNRAGSIINMSSVVGVFGNAGQANYAASKAGIIGFTKSIAKELGSRNIRCNAIAPGFIETDMTDAMSDKARDTIVSNIPMKRLGTTDDVAKLVMFLSSDDSSYISGQVVSICGALNC